MTAFGSRVPSGIAIAAAFAVVLGPGVSSWNASPDASAPPMAADIYGFRLRGTMRAQRASGIGLLQLADSPFGIAVTRDGHVMYDLIVKIDGLRPPGTLGGTEYVAWITTPELDRTLKLGTLQDGGIRTTVSSMNKFILMVTAERTADVDKRSGPIVVRGVSPSGLMDSFDNHELFSSIPH